MLAFQRFVKLNFAHSSFFAHPLFIFLEQISCVLIGKIEIHCGNQNNQQHASTKARYFE